MLSLEAKKIEHKINFIPDSYFHDDEMNEHWLNDYLSL